MLEKFDDLLGKVLTSVENRDNNELIFTLDNGEVYKLYHEQDCCEDVRIDDIVGDLSDLIGTPILLAEETNYGIDKKEKEWDDVSWTWTFYKLATIKGYVTIKWYGVSNGYYSESVAWCKVEGIEK